MSSGGNSFLYCPLLRALLPEYPRDWEQRNRDHPLAGAAWGRALDALRASPATDVGRASALLHSQAALLPPESGAREVADRVGRAWHAIARNGYLTCADAVGESMEYGGYIHQVSQEAALVLFIAQPRHRSDLMDAADAIRAADPPAATTLYSQESRTPAVAQRSRGQVRSAPYLRARAAPPPVRGRGRPRATREGAARLSQSAPPAREARVEREPPYPADNLPSQRLDQAPEGQAAPQMGSQAGWTFMRGVDLEHLWRIYVPTLQKVPAFFRGRWTSAVRFALDEVREAEALRQQDPERWDSAWALWLLLPRLLLCRTRRPPAQRKTDLLRRCTAFVEGRWEDLCSIAHEGRQADARLARQQPAGDEIPGATLRRMVSLTNDGQLSRAAALLSSLGVAPGTPETLDKLRRNRAQEHHGLSEVVTGWAPLEPVHLKEGLFLHHLRKAGKGLSAGCSGLRNEHLQVLLECPFAVGLLYDVACSTAQAKVPMRAQQVFRLARLTALNKPQPGRLRPIAAGDTFRRLVASALASQVAPRVRDAVAPYAFGVAVKSSIEAVSHLLRTVTDSDSEAVILSIDGIGAYDYIRRNCMLDKLRQVEPALLPFCRVFYDRPSEHLWFDNRGEAHSVASVEGGDQGDPMMPALFSLGMDGAIRAIAGQLQPGEFPVAFLDDVYIRTTRGRVAAVLGMVRETLLRETGIDVNLGKTKAWTRAGGAAPEGLPQGVWVADAAPEARGPVILGAPVGSPQFVQRFLEDRLALELKLLNTLPKLGSVQWPGCSCTTARLPRQTTFCGCFRQRWWLDTQEATTRPS